MIKMKSQTRFFMSFLLALALLSLLLYLYPFNGQLSSYVLQLRLKKLMAYALAALVASLSTISFQTVTGNRFLTPAVLGLESLYVLIQSFYFFFLWRWTRGSLPDVRLEFIVLLALLLAFFACLQPLLHRLLKQGFGTILLICMALGTLFRTSSTFLQVLMDPNEYDKMQGKLFASFQRINEPILLMVTLLVLCLTIFFYRRSSLLDVLHLGRVQASLLGVSVIKVQKQVLWGVVLLTAASTAMIGPMSFFGFMMTNLIYLFLKEYRHQLLFTASFLLGFSFLVLGQMAIERLFQMSMTIAMLVELMGGLLFFYLLYKERLQS